MLSKQGMIINWGRFLYLLTPPILVHWCSVTTLVVCCPPPLLSITRLPHHPSLRCLSSIVIIVIKAVQPVGCCQGWSWPCRMSLELGQVQEMPENAMSQLSAHFKWCACAYHDDMACPHCPFAAITSSSSYVVKWHAHAYRDDTACSHCHFAPQSSEK